MKTAVLFLTLLSAPIFAQTPRPTPPAPAAPPAQAAPPAPPLAPPPDLGKWWKNSEIASSLKLSQQQITQIEQTFQETRLKLIDLRADVARQEALLEPLIETDQLDEAKIGAQIDAVLAARGKLEKTNVMMMLAFRKVLTTEQWKKLDEFKERGPRTPAAAPRPPQPPRPPEDAPHL